MDILHETKFQHKQKRNYKDKVLKMKLFNTGAAGYVDFKLTPSLDKLLTNLDNGINTCIETCRQSRRTITSCLYAIQVLMNEENSIIAIYGYREMNSKDIADRLIDLIRINYPNLTNIETEEFKKRILLSPNKKTFDKYIKDIKFIIYEDPIQFTRSRKHVNLLSSYKILSVITTHNPTYISKRRGFKYFEHVRFMYDEDGRKDSKAWLVEMSRALYYDLRVIRDEVLLDHSGSCEPIKELEEIIKNI